MLLILKQHQGTGVVDVGSFPVFSDDPTIRVDDGNKSRITGTKEKGRNEFVESQSWIELANEGRQRKGTTRGD